MSATSSPARDRCPAANQPRNPISRARFERIAGRSVSAFGLVFGLQTFPVAIAQLPALKAPWGMVGIVVVFGLLAVIPILAIAQVYVKIAMGTLAVVYLISVVTWPLLAVNPDAIGQKPWVWFLCTVATAYAAVAFPLWLATAYTFVTPIAYGIIRALPSGGGVGAEIAGLDSVYAIILGGVILVIIAMLRQAASAVDDAQSAALAQYATAVRQHATEVERVQVDAIVHDSVLTTLLSAASARTPEAKALAARMASDAIGHLHAAEAADPEDQTLVGLDRLSDRITAAAAAFSSPFTIDVRDVEVHTVPVHVAEAVYSATRAGDGEQHAARRRPVASRGRSRSWAVDRSRPCRSPCATRAPVSTRTTCRPSGSACGSRSGNACRRWAVWPASRPGRARAPRSRSCGRHPTTTSVAHGDGVDARADGSEVAS